ncbi:MAG TPA: response regulator [Oscillatoriales cyanobacterium M59_W2019_021]|nr:response regulator [Oscillatoriales cyanobacterium M4454_W2019_049]HIK50904.1 response regulator [Oscillatoriales cyanobacterium M59_W2019_021]
MTQTAILCVDDEQTILDSLKIELENAFGDDNLIEVAQGGEEALEVIEELIEDDYEIAIIISDYIMPDMKGDELLKRIHELSPKTLKIMLTGQADLTAVANAINYAKLYRYIAKPWHPEDLSLTVSEALSSYQLDKQLAQKTIELETVNRALEAANQEQIKLIAQLKENEDRLTQFLEAMPVGVFVTDSNGQPYYLNSRAQNLLGRGLVEVADPHQLREVYQLYLARSDRLYPDDRDIILRALNGESATVDDLEIRKGDRAIPIEAWGTPIYDAQGNITYTIAAFQDITERQKAEAERLEFTDRLLQLNRANERFVPSQFLRLLDKQSIVEVQLGESVEQTMSILFADIRSFTTLSEHLTLDENFRFINSFLSRMEPAILNNQGFIDKYIGDGIMALFGGDADDAIRAGIAMLHNLAEYNIHRGRSGYKPIEIGIGINTGNLMLGTVGGQFRMDGTVIGDAVNLASRVEGLTKYYGASLLISDRTFFALRTPEKYDLRAIDRVTVKGKSEKVSVFEVFSADPENVRSLKHQTKHLFEQAVVLYQTQYWQDAEGMFSQCLTQNPGDRVAKIYLERCRQARVNG